MALVVFSNSVSCIDWREHVRERREHRPGRQEQAALLRVLTLRVPFFQVFSEGILIYLETSFLALGNWWWKGEKCEGGLVRPKSFSKYWFLLFVQPSSSHHFLPLTRWVHLCLTCILLAQLIHLSPLPGLFSGNDYSVNSYVHASGKVLWYRLWLHWQHCQEKCCTWLTQEIIVIQIMSSSSIVLLVLKQYFHVRHKVVFSKGRDW